MNTDIFIPADMVVSQRLQELPCEGVETMKQAGYNAVWSSFLGDFFESGWDVAALKAGASEGMQKTAGDDEFVVGQIEALEVISAVKDVPEIRDWYSSIKVAYDHQRLGLAFDEEFEGVDLAETAWYGPIKKEASEAGDAPQREETGGKISQFVTRIKNKRKQKKE